MCLQSFIVIFMRSCNWCLCDEVKYVILLNDGVVLKWIKVPHAYMFVHVATHFHMRISFFACTTRIQTQDTLSPMPAAQTPSDVQSPDISPTTSLSSLVPSSTLSQLSLLETLYVTLLVMVQFYSLFVHGLFGFLSRFEFIPLMLTSVSCAVGIIWTWLQFSYHVLTEWTIDIIILCMHVDKINMIKTVIMLVENYYQNSSSWFLINLIWRMWR